MSELDKEELLKAVDDYDAYPLKQREILKLLISISFNDTAVIKPMKIAELVNTTRATTYLSLSRLKNDKALVDINNRKGRHNTYRLNPERLNEIVTLFKNKLEYSKKIT